MLCRLLRLHPAASIPRPRCEHASVIMQPKRQKLTKTIVSRRMELCTYGLHSYGLYSYGIYSYGLQPHDAAEWSFEMVSTIDMASAMPMRGGLDMASAMPMHLGWTYRRDGTCA